MFIHFLCFIYSLYCYFLSCFTSWHCAKVNVTFAGIRHILWKVLFTYYHVSIVLLIVFVDLYGAWLAPRFESDLLVETWQRAKILCSNCTGTYKVLIVSNSICVIAKFLQYCKLFHNISLIQAESLFSTYRFNGGLS